MTDLNDIKQELVIYDKLSRYNALLLVNELEAMREALQNAYAKIREMQAELRALRTGASNTYTGATQVTVESGAEGEVRRDGA